jgi:hypothetical protein
MMVLLHSFSEAKLVAFADALRRAVYEELRVPPDFEYERDKDLLLFDGNKKSVRDHLIQCGDLGRALDPAHWVKRAFADYFVKPPGMNLICSDYRFKAELGEAEKAGIVVHTLRLYRSEVPVPPAGLPSEHSLDDVATDFLLVSETDADAEKEKLCKIMPQYAGYVSAGVL